MPKLSFLIVITLLLSGCLQFQPLDGSESFLPALDPESDIAGTELRFQPGECPIELPAGEAQLLNIECGFLEVPEMRTATDGRTIKLAVVIVRHPGGAPEADPIIYLVGGPGGSMLKIVEKSGVAPTFGPVFAANRDIVLFDQRGVGYSEPALECPAFAQLYLDLFDFEVDGQQLDAQARLDAKIEALWSCAGSLAGIADLSAYNSTESADDVEDLRRALGYEQVNLWGASYGARLALEVLRRHPDGVRSVILEATYPPEADLFLETPADYARSLELLAAECTVDDGCNDAYPDLQARLFATVERLNLDPVAVEVVHPFRAEEYPLAIDGDTLLELIFRAFYDSNMRPVLPMAIVAAEEDNFDLLLPLAATALPKITLTASGWPGNKLRYLT